MANKMILMTKIRQILRLYCQGESKRRIGELTNTARNTLRKYIKQFIQGHFTIESIDEMNDHQLELVFATVDEPVMDHRLAHLQGLLPDLEKQIKRKGVTITSCGSNTLGKIQEAIG